MIKKLKEDQLYFAVEKGQKEINEVVPFILCIDGHINVYLVNFELYKLVGDMILDCGNNIDDILYELNEHDINAHHLAEVENEQLTHDVMLMLTNMTMDKLIAQQKETMGATVMTKLSADEIIERGNIHVAIKDSDATKDITASKRLCVIMMQDGKFADYSISVYSIRKNRLLHLIYVTGKMTAGTALRTIKDMDNDVDNIYSIEDAESEIIIYAMMSKINAACDMSKIKEGRIICMG